MFGGIISAVLPAMYGAPESSGVSGVFSLSYAVLGVSAFSDCESWFTDSGGVSVTDSSLESSVFLFSNISSIISISP